MVSFSSVTCPVLSMMVSLMCLDVFSTTVDGGFSSCHHTGTHITSLPFWNFTLDAEQQRLPCTATECKNRDGGVSLRQDGAQVYHKAHYRVSEVRSSPSVSQGTYLHPLQQYVLLVESWQRVKINNKASFKDSLLFYVSKYLLVYMCAHYVVAWCLQRSEKDIRSTETGAGIMMTSE